MIQYQYFNKFVLRTPINSLEELNIRVELKTFINDKRFLQSINLSSPSLYADFNKRDKR